MITKQEAQRFVTERDATQIQDLVDKIDRAIRTNWNGKAIAVGTGHTHLPEHVVAGVKAKCSEAGWTVTYRDGGSDQREGSWNGQFTVQ